MKKGEGRCCPSGKAHQRKNQTGTVGSPAPIVFGRTENGGQIDPALKCERVKGGHSQLQKKEGLASRMTGETETSYLHGRLGHPGIDTQWMRQPRRGERIKPRPRGPPKPSGKGSADDGRVTACKKGGNLSEENTGDFHRKRKEARMIGLVEEQSQEIRQKKGTRSGRDRGGEKKYGTQQNRAHFEVERGGLTRREKWPRKEENRAPTESRRRGGRITSNSVK